MKSKLLVNAGRSDWGSPNQLLRDRAETVLRNDVARKRRAYASRRGQRIIDKLSRLAEIALPHAAVGTVPRHSTASLAAYPSYT